LSADIQRTINDVLFTFNALLLERAYFFASSHVVFP